MRYPPSEDTPTDLPGRSGNSGEPTGLSDRSGRSGRSGKSSGGSNPTSSPDASYTDSYGRTLTYPPSHFVSLDSQGSHSRGSADGHPEGLPRRSSLDSGRNIRKKLKYESKCDIQEKLLRGSVNTDATGATEATDKAGNGKRPGQSRRRSSYGSGIHQSGSKGQRGLEHEDATLKTEKTASICSSSTGSRRRRASGGLDSSIEEGTEPAIPTAERASSKTSSSTGSRRRRQERERQRSRVAAAAAGGHVGTDTLDGSLNDGRILPVLEGVEVGGENFVQELNVGGVDASTTDNSHCSWDHSRRYSKGESRGDRSRSEYFQSDYSRGNRAAKQKNYDRMDWPEPQDHFMDNPPRTTSSASGSSSHRSGGVAVLHTDDVASAQSNMYAAAQQHAQLEQPQAPQPSGPRKAVLHACDDKGRCLFHPHIILRKKALLGLGWKDVLPACPECESEDMGGEGVVEGGDASVTDKPGTSTGSAIRRASLAEEEEEDDESYGSSDSEESDDAVDEGSDGYSSSSLGDASSGCSSSGELSYSSGEDELDATVDSEQPTSAGQSEISLLRKWNKEQMEQGAKEAIAGGARKINRLAGEVASGAGSKIKKLKLKEDYISSYISSGVPSRPTKKKSKQNEAYVPKDYDPFFDRPVGGGKQRYRRRSSASDEVEAEDEPPLPPSLAPDKSVGASTDQASAQTQQGKNVLASVSKGMSKFIGKGKSKIKAKATVGKAQSSASQVLLQDCIGAQGASIPTIGRRSSAGTEGDRRKGAPSHSKHRQRHIIHTMEGRRYRNGDKHRSRDPRGNSVFINEGRVRNTGSFTVGAAGKSDTLDISMGSFPAHAQIDVDVEETIEEESSSQRLLKSASYQWDRVPLPEPDEAAKTSTQESAIDEEGGESSMDEDSSSQRLLKDASYQWDRVPLPAKHMATVNDESKDSESESDDSSNDESDSSSEEDEQPQTRNPSPQQDEIMRRSLESLNVDDEVITNRNRMLSTSSGRSKSHTSGDLGLLSMDDLLQSIQKDILGSAHRADHAARGSSRGSKSLSSLHDDHSSSIPQLDRTSSSREETASVGEIEAELEAASKTDGVNEEGKKLEPVSTPATPAEPPLAAPKQLPLVGNYGGLKIDLSALQASKPTLKIKGLEEEDGQELSTSDLQASKSIGSHEKMDAESSEGAISGSQQPQEKKASLFDESVKTFETTNLPYTGQFGESGMYTGPVNAQYEPHGKGTMVYDNGQVLVGYWNVGELVKESDECSDEEGDDEDDDEEEDLSSSMANVSSRDRSRVNSPSPPPPEYNVGDPGKHRDMILDKEVANVIIQQLKFGDGAFIRRSDGNWTYAKVKSFEETSEGKSSIRFIVNDRNSSKSYAKKYWGTHVRPVKGTKVKPEPEKENREGRTRELTGEVVANDSGAAQSDNGEGIACPPTQSRLTFDWGMAPQPVRHGRSRSRSRHRAVSFSRERQLVAIAESDVEDEEEGEDDSPVKGGLGALAQMNYELKGVDP
ncbi:hypothetical protein ACHAXT_002906 [Thalassiosira profunda]